MTRRAISWAALLYPIAWRKRYGEEFGALLEDSDGGWRAFTDVLKGAIAMQLRVGGWMKWVAACGVVGAVVAGAAYWQTPKKYVSTAVLRVSGGDLDRLIGLEQAVLSRTSLVQVIVQNELYHEARAEQPIEDIVWNMRTHDIAIRPVSAPGNTQTEAFTVSYSTTNPQQAQRVTDALVKHFQTEAPAGIPVEVLDRASLPVRPSSPRGDRWIVFGLASGLAAGLAVSGARRWPWVAAAGVAGALIGFGISAIKPKVWISSAVVRGDIVQQGIALVDDATIERLLADTNLNLYAEERERLTSAQLAQQLRNNLSIQAILPPQAWNTPHKPVALISFRYPDRAKAQEVMRSIVARFAKAGAVMILDPPSQPDRPFQPQPANWAMAGLLAGIICGIVFTCFHGRLTQSPAHA